MVLLSRPLEPRALLPSRLASAPRGKSGEHNEQQPGRRGGTRRGSLRSALRNWWADDEIRFYMVALGFAAIRKISAIVPLHAALSI